MAHRGVWNAWLAVVLASVLGIVPAMGLDRSSEPAATGADARTSDSSNDSSARESAPYTVTPMVVPTAIGVRKHALGNTTALAAIEVGKIYIPSRYGGVLTLRASAKLYYTDGSDLTTTVATQIYQGSLEASLVAQGNPCTYTVPAGRWGWFYFLVPGGTSGVSNTFIEDGQAAYRPWNGWWWGYTNVAGPTLHDAGGPMDKYDQVYNGSSGTAVPGSGTTFYQENLDSNPGWTTQGAWAWGVPTGKGGDHGGADPKAGYTGTSVYGYNLTGGYANNMAAQSLTTTAINCSGQTGIHLRFRRWLGIEESIYDHASVQVSSNLTNWTTVWNFGGATLIETGWSLQEYDISAVADGQPAVYIRWDMGATDVGWTYGGWNIDDIQLVSIPPVNTFYRQNLDSNPGWTTEGAWAWGVPTGKGGDHGGADPKAGYTGTSVYGYNLAGGYTNNMTAKSLTTTAINCTGQTGIHLRFRRWLGIESSAYDQAGIQVTSNIADPNAWVSLWTFSGATLTETGWSLQEYDISAVADNKPAVYIRWVLGPTDVGWTYGGWNIDDIELTSGNSYIPPPMPRTYARSWETSNQGSGAYWYGHCWGWSIAAILMPMPQATTKNGVSFTRDDMKGLYTELADNDPYFDPSLYIAYIPPTAPNANLGQDVDWYCDDLYRILRICIREDRVPIQSDMRAITTPPNRQGEVWNQSIYKYSSSFREVSGANNERLIEIDMNVYSNFDLWAPPTDYVVDRREEFIYRLEFDAQGQVIANSSKQNWTYASHYPPQDLYRLTGTRWVSFNPHMTKSRVDALYQP